MQLERTDHTAAEDAQMEPIIEHFHESIEKRIEDLSEATRAYCNILDKSPGILRRQGELFGLLGEGAGGEVGEETVDMCRAEREVRMGIQLPVFIPPSCDTLGCCLWLPVTHSLTHSLIRSLLTYICDPRMHS